MVAVTEDSKIIYPFKDNTSDVSAIVMISLIISCSSKKGNPLLDDPILPLIVQKYAIIISTKIE